LLAGWKWAGTASTKLLLQQFFVFFKKHWEKWALDILDPWATVILPYGGPDYHNPPEVF